MIHKTFVYNNFILETDSAHQLYCNYSANKPIIDFHCHLNTKTIAEDHQFDNLGDIWLGGDHYKWREMRINGINEKYITRDVSDKEKFTKWAETMSFTEYFRRIVCNYVGNQAEKGLIPDDEQILKTLIEGVSYNNAKSYFNI